MVVWVVISVATSVAVDVQIAGVVSTFTCCQRLLLLLVRVAVAVENDGSRLLALIVGD